MMRELRTVNQPYRDNVIIDGIPEDLYGEASSAVNR